MHSPDMSSSLVSPADAAVPLALFGDGAVFHHVGVAVPSIASLGVPNLRATADERQRVSVAFVETGGAMLELVEPLGADSPVQRSLREGQVLVHLCFAVPNLATAIARSREAGFHRLAAPVPAAALNARRIAWVFSRTFGLVELLEGSR